MHDGRKVGGRTVTYILLGSFTRKIGYDKPHSGDVAPEFLEFYWGNWLRGALPLAAFDLDERSGYRQAVAPAASLMVTLAPQQLVGDSGFTARQLGGYRSVTARSWTRLRVASWAMWPSTARTAVLGNSRNLVQLAWLWASGLDAEYVARDRFSDPNAIDAGRQDAAGIACPFTGREQALEIQALVVLATGDAQR